MSIQYSYHYLILELSSFTTASFLSVSSPASFVLSSSNLVLSFRLLLYLQFIIIVIAVTVVAAVGVVVINA